MFSICFLSASRSMAESTLGSMTPPPRCIVTDAAAAVDQRRSLLRSSAAARRPRGSAENACVLDGRVCGYMPRDTRARTLRHRGANARPRPRPRPSRTRGRANVAQRTAHPARIIYPHAISIIVQKPKARAAVYAIRPPAILSGRAARQHRRPAARARRPRRRYPTTFSLLPPPSPRPITSNRAAGRPAGGQ